MQCIYYDLLYCWLEPNVQLEGKEPRMAYGRRMHGGFVPLCQLRWQSNASVSGSILHQLRICVRFQLLRELERQ